MPREARSQRILITASTLISLPILVFFWIALRFSVNIPHQDDYDAILSFINAYSTSPSLPARLFTALTWQHTNYKLIFANFVVAADFELSGHVNFVLLQQIGNAFVLGIALILWKLFHPAGVNREHRILLFLPVIFLLFGPRYFEAIDFANTALFYLPGAFFAILCIFLLAHGPSSSRSFSFACLAFILAVATSATGFFLAPAGGLLLLQQRKPLRLTLWALICIALVFVYLIHYRNVGSGVGSISALHRLATLTLFPFAFLGASLSRLYLALPLGLSLTALLVYLSRRGWPRQDPAVFFCALFLLITAFAVAVLRHGLGLQSAVSSRYSAYSALFLIFIYMGLLKLHPVALGGRKYRTGLAAFGLITALLCVHSELVANRALAQRKALLIQHLQAWQRDPTHTSLVPDEDPIMRTPGMSDFRQRAERILRESIRLRTYVPSRSLP